jgi:CII-binding regulator of phage lambda lysogenization HflD
VIVAEAITGLSALKTAFDITKALKDINDAAIRNGAVIDLQEKILAARDAPAALVERVEALEEELEGFKRWEADKLEYELTEIYSKTYAYLIKESVRGARPPHLVCTNCFEARKKSILQRSDAAHLACPECKTRIRFDQPSRPTDTKRYNPHRGW